jgi:hypothetical protein
MKLFLTAFLQVFLVTVNTVFITKNDYLGVFGVSFFISLFWTFNVKSIAFSHNRDKYIYSFGAATGGLAGLILIGNI